MIAASLTVRGDDLDFDECTRVVGIPPTDTFVRQFEYDSSVLAARQWSIESGREELESVDDAVAALLAVFGDRLGAVRDYAAGPGRSVRVCCSVHIPPTDTFVRQFEYDSSVLAARQWSIESGREELESVDDAVAALLAVFGDRLGAVRDYAAGPGRGVVHFLLGPHP